MNNFNELAKQIHQQNVDAGWWVDMNRDVYQTLQLVSTELAEATEGERKNLMDDHLPHRKMGEVELADALIRIFDLAGRYGWEYQGGHFINQYFHQMNCVAGRHLVCNIQLCTLTEFILFDADSKNVAREYTAFVNTVLAVGASQGYDVMGALADKLEYNKHRLDHKPESRAQEHGKKF